MYISDGTFACRCFFFPSFFGAEFGIRFAGVRHQSWTPIETQCGHACRSAPHDIWSTKNTSDLRTCGCKIIEDLDIYSKSKETIFTRCFWNMIFPISTWPAPAPGVVSFGFSGSSSFWLGRWRVMTDGMTTIHNV